MARQQKNSSTMEVVALLFAKGLPNNGMFTVC